MTTATGHSTVVAPSAVEQDSALFGLIAEFDNVDAVMAAAKAVREAGYKRFDVHSPFPIHGIDAAIGIRPTILPWLVLGGGLAGCAGGLFLTIFTMSIDYPYMISGKPYNSLPAWIPVVFECTILLAALTTVFGMFLLNKLPRLYNPLFTADRFRRATNDRFFVVVEARDEKFDEDTTAALLRKHGATGIETVED